MNLNPSEGHVKYDERSITVSNLGGNTVVFDSFSSEKDVSERRIPGNPHPFTDTKFTVRVAGVVSAMVTPMTATRFRLSAKKRKRPQEQPRRIEVKVEQPRRIEVKVEQPLRIIEAEQRRTVYSDTIDLTAIQDLHMQISLQKQKCAMLLSGGKADSFKAALTGSTACNPLSVPSSAASSAEIVTCRLSPGLDERTAISVLQNLGV